MWTDGLTPADRQAAWDAMSPLWREINRDMLSTIVSELVTLPPDQAAEVAADILAFVDFGDFGDILERARLFSGEPPPGTAERGTVRTAAVLRGRRKKDGRQRGRRPEPTGRSGLK